MYERFLSLFLIITFISKTRARREDRRSAIGIVREKLKSNSPGQRSPPPFYKIRALDQKANGNSNNDNINNNDIIDNKKENVYRRRSF